MRIVACTDIEGVAGLTSFADQAYGTGKYYEESKRLLTAEVNAAVDGMVAAGAEDIMIMDGHGAGGIVYSELHPAARLMHGRPLATVTIWQEVYRDFDLGVMIGQHSMAGTERGPLSHTQSSTTIEWYKLNGKMIGEIAQFALFIGALGIPLIYLSGDDVACREVEELIPGITTAAVKIGLGRTSAISLSKERSRDLITATMKEALERQKVQPVKPLVWKGPFTLEKRFLLAETADAESKKANSRRVDAKTVAFESDSILDIIYA